MNNRAETTIAIGALGLWAVSVVGGFADYWGDHDAHWAWLVLFGIAMCVFAVGIVREH